LRSTLSVSWSDDDVLLVVMGCRVVLEERPTPRAPMYRCDNVGCRNSWRRRRRIRHIAARLAHDLPQLAGCGESARHDGAFAQRDGRECARNLERAFREM